METKQAKEVIKEKLELMQQLTLKEEFYKTGFLLQEIIDTINNSFDEDEYSDNKLIVVHNLFVLQDDFRNYIDSSLKRKFNQKVYSTNSDIVLKIRSRVWSLVEK